MLQALNPQIMLRLNRIELTHIALKGIQSVVHFGAERLHFAAQRSHILPVEQNPGNDRDQWNTNRECFVHLFRYRTPSVYPQYIDYTQPAAIKDPIAALRKC